MKILIDIGHPAHVHFFHHPIRLLREEGHEILVTSRDKEMALELLDRLGIPHEPLSRHAGGGVSALVRELFQRDLALLGFVRRQRPDVMAAIGGTFIAHVGRLTGIPSLVFYDTENAVLQNAITYPFASRVVVPRCYRAWTPRRKETRYDGYHELSYLHPARFTPDRDTALAQGLAPDGDTFLVRVVSWQASHDIGEDGWNPGLLGKVVDQLLRKGKVILSAESSLPDSLEPFRYQGDSSRIHHLMAFCRGFVGESATMASECAVLGVPAIYAAVTGRGYTDEQEQRYRLVKNVRELTWPLLEQAIDQLMAMSEVERRDRRRRLLEETIDVAPWVAACLTAYPDLPDGRAAAQA